LAFGPHRAAQASIHTLSLAPRRRG